MNDAHNAISRHGNLSQRFKHSLWNDTGACVNKYMWTSDFLLKLVVFYIHFSSFIIPTRNHSSSQKYACNTTNTTILYYFTWPLHWDPWSTKINWDMLMLVALGHILSNFVALECIWLHLFALGCTSFHFTEFGWSCSLWANQDPAYAVWHQRFFDCFFFCFVKGI